MSEMPYWSPHETRVFALQVAVEYINGDCKRGNFYTAENVLDVANKFEAWLTRKPVAGFEVKAPDETDEAA